MPKNSWEWNESDLESIITNQVQENLELEYKGAAALGQADGKKNEISKDVSSFAHSAGSVIVYGIQESSGKPPRVPVALDGVDPSHFSNEWLEQVISSRIRPRIDGIRINPVQLSGSLAGKVAYVVWVPQTNTLHQASDHRYYKRFNFQSVPMEHYEIEDIRNRAIEPELDVVIGLTKMWETAQVGQLKEQVSWEHQSLGFLFPIHLGIVNRGSQVAEVALLEFGVDPETTISESSREILSAGERYVSWVVPDSRPIPGYHGVASFLLDTAKSRHTVLPAFLNQGPHLCIGLKSKGET